MASTRRRNVRPHAEVDRLASLKADLNPIAKAKGKVVEFAKAAFAPFTGQRVLAAA